MATGHYFYSNISNDSRLILHVLTQCDSGDLSSTILTLKAYLISKTRDGLDTDAEMLLADIAITAGTYSHSYKDADYCRYPTYNKVTDEAFWETDVEFGNLGNFSENWTPWFQIVDIANLSHFNSGAAETNSLNINFSVTSSLSENSLSVDTTVYPYVHVIEYVGVSYYHHFTGDTHTVPGYTLSVEGCKHTGWVDSSGTSYEPEDKITVQTPLQISPEFTQDTDSGATVTVCFDTRGGTAMDPVTVTVGSPYFDNIPMFDNMEGITEKYGYTFSGWYYNGTLIDENTTCTTTIDHTLIASWAPKEYNILLEFNYAWGPYIEERNVTYGHRYGELLSLPVPTQEGYVFTGWYKYYTNELVTDTTIVTSGIDLYAGWQELPKYHYQITYNDTLGINDEQIDEESCYDTTATSHTITVNSNPFIAKNRSFRCWNEHPAGISTEYYEGDTIILNPTKNEITLYAIWQDNSVIYDANGGTFDSGDTVIEYIPLDVENPFVIDIHTTLSQAGYEFVCWNTKQDGSGNDYNVDDPIDYGNNNTITLYAKWAKAKYTVTFKDWDGTVISSEQYMFGQAVVPPSVNPTRPADMKYNYTFAGWNPIIQAFCDGAKTYTAKYTENYIDYTVKFLDHDNSVVKSSNYHYGARVAVPAAQTRQATDTHIYTFNGWRKTSGNTLVEAPVQTYHYKFDGSEAGFWTKGCIGDDFTQATMHEGALYLTNTTGIRHWATIGYKYSGLENLKGKVFGMSATFQLPAGNIFNGTVQLLVPLTGSSSGNGVFAGGITLTHNTLYAGNTSYPMITYEQISPNTTYVAEIVYDYRITGQAQGRYYVYKENGDIVAEATIPLASLSRYYETADFHSIGFRVQNLGENVVKVDDFKTYVGDSFITCSGNDVFQASYEESRRKYWIYFDTSDYGGDPIDSLFLENGREIGSLPTPSRKYYKFTGWGTIYGYNDFFGTDLDCPLHGSCLSIAETDDMPRHDLYLHAHWEPITVASIKVGGEFKTGIPFIKIGTEWKRPVGVYIKTSNGWKRSTK